MSDVAVSILEPERNENVLEISLPAETTTTLDIEMFMDVEKHLLIVHCRSGHVVRESIPEHARGSAILSSKFSKKRHKLIVKFSKNNVLNTNESPPENFLEIENLMRFPDTEGVKTFRAQSPGDIAFFFFKAPGIRSQN